MSTTGVRRVPAGVREGGRFAPGSAGEADVTVADRPATVDPCTTRGIARTVAVDALSPSADGSARRAGIDVAARLAAGPGRDARPVEDRLEAAAGPGGPLGGRVAEALSVAGGWQWTADQLEAQSREWLDRAAGFHRQGRNPLFHAGGGDVTTRGERDVYLQAGALAAAPDTVDGDHVVSQTNVAAHAGHGPDALQRTARQAAGDFARV